MFDTKIYDTNRYRITELVQWDRNQTISIVMCPIEKSLNIVSDNVEVHVCKKTSEFATVIKGLKVEDNHVKVLIPNEFLETPGEIIFYVYLGDGKTVAKAVLGVVPRVQPSEQDIIITE